MVVANDGGKKKPTQPLHLAQFDIVLANAEFISNKQNLSLFQGVVWDRIVSANAMRMGLSVHACCSGHPALRLCT